jgi:hypothetical protein
VFQLPLGKRDLQSQHRIAKACQMLGVFQVKIDMRLPAGASQDVGQRSFAGLARAQDGDDRIPAQKVLQRFELTRPFQHVETLS